MAVSIGRAIISCERVYAELAFPPPPVARKTARPPPTLIHSSASVSVAVRRRPPALRLVPASLRGRRNAGQA